MLSKIGIAMSIAAENDRSAGAFLPAGPNVASPDRPPEGLPAPRAQPEPPQHQQRLLAHRPARGQHPELRGGVVEVEEAADPQQPAAAKLAVPDAVHDD